MFELNCELIYITSKTTLHDVRTTFTPTLTTTAWSFEMLPKKPHIEYKVIEISPEKKNHESNIHSRKA